MNREPPHKSMGFFGVFKDACKITFLWKKLFSQILLATILPLTILYLSAIQISDFIQNHSFESHKASLITSITTVVVYSILIFLFFLLSTSSIVYTVSCCYASKDTNFKKVMGVYAKVWGRLFVTCLLFFFILAVCTIVYLGLLLRFVASFNGGTWLALIICLTIPYLVVLIYIANVWNIAMVVSILEKDYGIKALAKGRKLIYGKIWVSVAVFVALQIISTGIILAFSWLVVDGMMILVGKIFLGIVCYLLSTILLHFSLVTQAVIYFVCKAYHDEEISNVGAHLDGSHVTLGRRNENQV